MTPHVDKKGGKTFIIDRTFEGIGRIKLASGTTSKALFRRMNDMLTELFDKGKFQILRDIQARRIALAVAYDLYRRGRLLRASSAASLQLALDAWQQRAGGRPATQRMRKVVVTALSDASKASTMVADLPDVLRALRAQLVATPTLFNSIRDHAIAFARDAEGRQSELYRGLQDIDPFDESARMTSSRRQHRNSQAPLAMREILNGLPELHRQDAWSLLLSGMRPAEFYAREGAGWELQLHAVQVNGTKTKNATRQVPRLELEGHRVLPPATTQQSLYYVLHTKHGMSLYDLRRSYANWLLDAGVPEGHAMIYMGHGARSLTWHYARRAPTADEMIADAARVARWYAAEIATKPTVLPTVGKTSTA